MTKGFTLPARTLVSAGFVPLPWFFVFTTVAGLMKPGYGAAAQHVSELTAEPGLPGKLVNVAALGSGLAYVLFAAGLWIQTRRTVSYGSLCWLLFGLAMMSNGVWPIGHPLHGAYALGIANLVAPSLSLLELRDLRDRSIPFAVTVGASLSGLLYLWLNLTGNDPEGCRGLTQRVFSAINSLWPAVIAWYLVRAGDRRS